MADNEDDPRRGTGRTTALVLSAISQALLIPDTEIAFCDHASMHPVDLADHTRAIASLLGLKLLVQATPTTVHVCSPISLLRKA